MSRASKEVPAEGSYSFVLRRSSPLDPRFAELAPARGEPTVKSRDITHPDGLRRRTLFIRTRPVRDRYMKLGWEDVTRQWMAARQTAQKAAEAAEAIATPSRRPEPEEARTKVTEEAPPEPVEEPDPKPKPKRTRRSRRKKAG